MVWKPTAFGIVWLTLLPAGARAIEVDGRLDEPEWAGAQVFDDYRQTEPLTRNVAKHRTELRILPRPEGLFIGVIAESPPAERTHGRSQRDAQSMDGDPIAILIDFEGRGRTAYEFTVSISGSVRDSVVLNQTDISTDWDAVWDVAVHEDDKTWTAEYRIPWSVAAEGVVHGDTRTIGIYSSRFLKNVTQRFALPAIELLGATFVQDFKRIEVPRYKTSSIDVVPYVSGTANRLDSNTRIRGGIDLLWKPNGSQRLSATLKPDFGQVESDDLVVNFSAIETFFSDKRPFFTEGQQLFDLRTTQNGRLINTRRIGGAPDAGPEGSSDVLAGAKFTGSGGDNEYGIFTAIEDDSSLAKGRDYFAARWHRKYERSSIGYLGTYTRRPTLDRDAIVHSVDFDTTFSHNLKLNAQAIVTDIRAPNPAAAGNRRGFGAWATLKYQPGGAWQQALRLTWFDRGFDINDLGYMERASLRQINSETYWYKRSYPQASHLSNSNWFLSVNINANDFGRHLPANAELGHNWQFKNGDNVYANYYGESAGIDDLLLRGHGDVRLRARNELRVQWETAQAGRLRSIAWAKVFQEGVRGWAWELHAEPKVFITETLSIGAQATYDDSRDWLIWAQGNAAASYKRRQFTLAINGDWYLRPKHELRLKAQWVGLQARFMQSYAAAAGGDLMPSLAVQPDFELSNVAVQLRYRYEIGPLSDLYVVYSRGGDVFDASTRRSFGAALGDAWRNPSADQLFIKIRYRL
jgi:hypothetical protein